MRCYDRIITCLDLRLPQELFKSLAKDCSFRQPQRKTLANLIRKSKKFKLLTQFSVIAFLRFFEEMQILFQFFLLRKSNAINTREHLILFITSPVCSRNIQQFYCFDKTRIWYVRPTAQVSKITLLIECYRTILQVIDQFNFILIALLPEIF